MQAQCLHHYKFVMWMSNPKQKEISIWVMGLKTKKLIKQIKSHVKNEALHKFLLVVNHYLPLFNLSTSPSGICRLFLLFILLGIFTLENEKKKIPNLQNLDWESVAAFLGFMPWTNFPWEGIFFFPSLIWFFLCVMRTGRNHFPPFSLLKENRLIP